MALPGTLVRGLVALALLVLAGIAAAGDTVGFSVSTLNNPFFVTMSDGVKTQAAASGVDVIVVDAQDKVDKQVSDVEDLVKKKVKVILLNPTDSAGVVPAVRAANAAGIPVITVDRAAGGGAVAYHIASDNVVGGRLAGEHLCKLLGGKGNVVELQGIPGSSAARDRGEGFDEALKGKCPKVKVVGRQTANFDRAQGLSVMENVLKRQPDLDAVFAQNDEMALGALQAIKASNRKVKVIGFDATDDAVKAVNACELAATIAQQPAEMGRLAVERAAALAKGAKPPLRTESVAVGLKLVTGTGCE